MQASLASTPRPRAEPRRRGTRVVLAVWAAVMLAVGADLLAGHLVALPLPEHGDSRLQAALEARRGAATGWLALHVLSGACGCSRRVIAHLVARGPTPLAAERVVLVDAEADQLARLERAGFTVETLAAEALEPALGVSSAPVLALASAAGALAYVGGYTERKRGPEIRDLDLLARLQAGEAPEPLPLFGCAVSAQLARRVDPLGIR